MSKSASWICLVAVVVLVNMILTGFGQNCPNFGVEFRACVEDTPYNRPCRVVDTKLDDGGTHIDCEGGVLTVHKIHTLKSGVLGSQIISRLVA